MPPEYISIYRRHVIMQNYPAYTYETAAEAPAELMIAMHLANIARSTRS